MSDRYLTPYGKPLRPSFANEKHGWAGEVNDLRNDTQDAFNRVAADVDAKNAALQSVASNAVNDTTALKALSVAGKTSGSFVWVRSVLDRFVYDAASTLADNGITIIQPTAGTGRWIRACAPHPYWQGQDTWYINATTGSDEDTGIATDHPLKTHAELARRVRDKVLTTNMDVHIQTDLAEVCFLDVQSASTASMYLWSVRYIGDPIVLYGPSAITAATAENVATNTCHDVTDDVLPVSWTDSGLVGHMIQRLDGGGAITGVGWVMKDLGTKKARIGATSAYTMVPGVWPGARFDFGVGNSFRVVKYPTVKGVGSLGTSVFCYGLYINNTPVVQSGALTPEIDYYGVKSVGDNARAAYAYAACCWFEDGPFDGSGGRVFSKSVFKRVGYSCNPAPGAYIQFLDCYFQEQRVNMGYASNYAFGKCGFFDLDVARDAALLLAVPGINVSISDVIWGSDNACAGIKVAYGQTHITYDSTKTPVLATTGNPITFLGVAKQYADMAAGITDAAKQSSITPR